MKSAQEWKPHIKLDEKRLVMRRKVDGEWQYREPTAEETAEYLAAEAW